MRKFLVPAVFAVISVGSLLAQDLPQDDAVRIREFYRLAAVVQDEVWPQWSSVPAPILLITEKGEFLTHYDAPPKDFSKLNDEFYFRPRQLATNLQATFPAFGPTPVIVIGEPSNTESKTSTPWLITLMHEHFHQLQDSQPHYYEGVNELGLSRGDRTGMWMLNYPFPYSDVAESFGHLRKLLLASLSEPDPKKFARAANEYAKARGHFFARLSTDDHKYLGFQLWQEGIARSTELKVAEAAARYHPTPEYAALADYELFSDYAAKRKREILDELRSVDIGERKREAVYSWGAAEGLLLDRLKPEWRKDYFSRPFSLDYFFGK